VAGPLTGCIRRVTAPRKVRPRSKPRARRVAVQKLDPRGAERSRYAKQRGFRHGVAILDLGDAVGAYSRLSDQVFCRPFQKCPPGATASSADLVIAHARILARYRAVQKPLDIIAR